MVRWFKKKVAPVTDEAEEGPKDFFEEILELSHLEQNKKDDLLYELGDFKDTNSVESEILLSNVKSKQGDNPWQD